MRIKTKDPNDACRTKKMRRVNVSSVKSDVHHSPLSGVWPDAVDIKKLSGFDPPNLPSTMAPPVAPSPSNPWLVDEAAVAIQSRLSLQAVAATVVASSMATPAPATLAQESAKKASKKASSTPEPPPEEAGAKPSFDRWALVDDSSINYGFWSNRNTYKKDLVLADSAATPSFYITTAINYSNGAAQYVPIPDIKEALGFTAKRSDPDSRSSRLRIGRSLTARLIPHALPLFCTSPH
jgi:hypothetical protein